MRKTINLELGKWENCKKMLNTSRSHSTRFVQKTLRIDNFDADDHLDIIIDLCSRPSVSVIE